VYNIGGEQELTNISLARRILALMNKSEDMIKFVQDRPGHDLRYSLDCRKMKQLGWQQQYTIEDGLKSTIDWYQAHESWWRPLKAGMDQKYFSGYWGAKK
jgi:dTDP-glucose 4,6-dehydratase